MSATKDSFVLTNDEVRIFSKTYGVYSVLLKLDAWWLAGGKKVHLIMKKDSDVVDTLYDTEAVGDGVVIPSLFLETAGKISVWIGQQTADSERVSSTAELTVEDADGIPEGGYIAVKTPSTDGRIEHIREASDGDIQVETVQGWKSVAEKDETDAALADKVDKIDGKGLSTNDFTDADRDSVRTALPNSVSELCGKVEAVQSGKVDKIDGKGLSTNDYTDEEKDFLNETVPQTFESTSAKISEIEVNVYNNYKNKVDKVVGKGLSTNDYTDEDKNNLQDTIPGAIQQLYDFSVSLEEKKVGKVTGKGLSSNDFTDEDKQLLNDTLPAMIDINTQSIGMLNSRKVDKVEGKGLSSNDFTDEEKAEVAKIAELPRVALSLADYDTRKRGYVGADGGYTASGSWFAYYYYTDRHPVKRLNAKLYSNTGTAYSVAFYSTKDSTTESFISGEKPKTIGANSFDDIVVPDNAALIVISTRFASGEDSNAELYVDTDIPATAIAKIEDAGSEGTGQVKRVFTDFPNANDFTFVKGELWGSAASGDKTVIHRYKITDDGLLRLGIITTDFGHLNTFDYNPANDCLIFGNGANDFSTEGNWFAVVKNPMGLVTSEYSATATLAANAVVYNVDIGFKVQAVWGDSNLGLNNIVYLLSNNAKTVTKVMLNVDDNGEFNGEYTVLDTHTSEAAYPVGGAKFWGDTLYFGFSDIGYKLALMSMTDYSVSVMQKRFYTADGTEITGTVQGLHIDDKYVWLFINRTNPIGYYLIQMYQCLGSLSNGGGAGVTVDSELSASSENPVQNKAIKAALDKKIDEPTGNGLVRKFMSGIYATVGVDITMPTSPTDNSVPTSKLVASQLNNKLDKPSNNGGVLYINSFDQPSIKGIASSAATSDTGELATVKIVKDYINSLDASEVSY